MDENKLVEDIQKRLDSTIADIKKDFGSYAKIEDFNKEIAALRADVEKVGNNDEAKQKLEDLTKEFSEFKKRAQEMQPATKQKTLAEKLYENRDLMKSIADKTIERKSFSLRAVVGSGNITADPNGFTLPDIGDLQRGYGEITPHFTQMTIGANSHGVLRYVDVASITNGAEPKAKSGTYPTTSTIAWQGYSLTLDKIVDRVAIQKEAFKDFDFVESQIRMFLMKNIEYKKDYYALLGTGTSPQIYGLKARATAWAVGDYATKYKGADLITLISVIATQIKTSTSEGTFAMFKPNKAFVNPAVLSVIKNAKDDFGRPLYPEWLFGAKVMIDGIEVIENKLVGADELYVGDFTYAELYTETPLELELGYASDTNDWEKDQMSIKGMWRGQMLIKNVNQNAFRYVSSITTALNEIKLIEA